MIIFDWHLHNVDIRYLPETQEAQLMVVHWGCIATDTDTQEQASAIGTVSVSENNYIYPASTVKNVTKTQVMQFLNNKLGNEKQEIKDKLAGELAARGLDDSFIPTD